MKLHFSKMHGLSNDFVVINTLTQTFNPTPELIQQLAHRQMGIGFDQMLLVGPAPSDQIDIDFSYRIFNADGSEVAQCGNGARCLARFIYEHQLSHKKHLRVQTLAGILELHIEAIDQIRVNMGIPNFVPANIPCLAKTILPRYQIDDIVFGAISLGNPHAVILVDNINQAPVEKIGRFLQAQAFFLKVSMLVSCKLIIRNTLIYAYTNAALAKPLLVVVALVPQ